MQLLVSKLVPLYVHIMEVSAAQVTVLSPGILDFIDPLHCLLIYHLSLVRRS
jgi:hypothetical protein